MRVGVDATCWWNRRGFGRFTRELLKAMCLKPRGHDLCFFVDQPPAPDLRVLPARIVRVGVSSAVTESAVASGRRSLRDVWKLRRAVNAEAPDLMFFPAVYSWFPVSRAIPTVVTLHDAIAESYPELLFPTRKGRALWSLKMAWARRSAVRVITVSRAAKGDIARYIGVPEDRIDVICEGADAVFAPVADSSRRAMARERVGLPPEARFLLFVGGFAPHKNLERLLIAFAGAIEGPDENGLYLVLAGDPEGASFHSNYEQVRAVARSRKDIAGRVLFPGFVADEILAALYADALAVVLPSVSEGFGLPVLEGMACGTPALVSNTGAASEIAGDASLVFDPFDTDDIARQIRRIATDAQFLVALRRAALARANQYSWSKAADLTFDSLELCVEQHQCASAW